MPREKMIALRDFARERGLWLLSDEVYCQFAFDGTVAPSFLQICESTDRLLVTNTFSKNWCMTGWRIGWAIYPDELKQVFDNLNQYNSTSVATFLQYGAATALDHGDAFIKSFVVRTLRARNIICSAIDGLPGIKVFWPQGTFYFVFAVEGLSDSYDLAVRILKEARVGVAPGSAFGPGSEAYLRVCYAVDPEFVEQGARRLVTFLGERPS